MVPKLTLVFVPSVGSFVINKMRTKAELKLDILRDGKKYSIAKRYLAFAVTITADELIAQTRNIVYSYMVNHAPLNMTLVGIEKEDTGLLCIIQCVEHLSFFILPIPYRMVIDSIQGKLSSNNLTPYAHIMHYSSVEELRNSNKTHIDMMKLGLSFDYNSVLKMK